ncbi:MAG: hypothetical protein HYZ28_26345 [Myxococcales bacterium]|nr:hypothetical protein [Myxococcales bacterium]
MRRLALPVLIALASAAGCDFTGKPPCNPSTCAGCCDAKGDCQPGIITTACGRAASQCVACLELQTCQLGFCTVIGTGGGAGGGGGGSDGGCQPTTCQQAAKNCGTIPEGCGGTAWCGDCPAGQSCGGGGTPNVCGTGSCTPKTCALLGKNCGSVSDGCGATLDCGSCQAPNVCGPDNICVTNCVPKTCGQLGATCGTPPDGCGGNLSCGTCAAPKTCGGGGTAFTCGASCARGCPPGYSCDANGTCAGGSASSLALNVVQAPKVSVSGVVTLNGGQPTSTCSTSDRATVYFKSKGDPSYDATIPVPCNGATTPFAFSGLVYPSTYEVSVRGGLSNLPSWTVVVSSNLTVSGPTSGLSLNVVQAPKVSVSGVLTLNGGQPTSNCSTSDRATVYFKSSANPNYDASIPVPCNGATTPFTFSGQVYPSTYQVSVRGGLSNLPSWTVVVNPSLTVSGPTSGLTLNVVQAPKVSVSGVVTLNGAQPTSNCSTSDRATVYFKSAANPNYDASIAVPCNGATTPFTFSGQVYPSTYEVSVRGGLSNLPSWTVVVNPSLTVSGPTSGLTLNVVQAPKVSVSGVVTLNGGQPTSNCSTSDRATVYFKSKSNSNYDATIPVPCSGATTPFTFSGQVYPSTYEVSVRGGLSNLPSWTVLVNTSLTISGPSSGLTLNVVQAPKVSVSGVVTLNGGQPTSNCSTSDRATVYFKSAANPNYDASISVPCNGATTPFTFSGQVYPSTFEVSVRGGLSNLPSWTVVVNTSLTINAPTSGLTLNVVQPPKVPVSGVVTLNGAQPTSNCSTSDRATVYFKSAANPNYDTFIAVPCNGATTPFTFSGQVYPSTYEISVRGGLSSLPSWTVVIVDRLQIP